jgi:hypothetical protein
MATIKETKCVAHPIEQVVPSSQVTFDDVSDRSVWISAESKGHVSSVRRPQAAAKVESQLVGDDRWLSRAWQTEECVVPRGLAPIPADATRLAFLRASPMSKHPWPPCADSSPASVYLRGWAAQDQWR